MLVQRPRVWLGCGDRVSGGSRGPVFPPKTDHKNTTFLAKKRFLTVLAKRTFQTIGTSTKVTTKP